ncbi:MAG: hypothetical protein ACUVQR_14990, partial [Thermogutta sp.]
LRTSKPTHAVPKSFAVPHPLALLPGEKGGKCGIPHRKQTPSLHLPKQLQQIADHSGFCVAKS